jgi:hypothetical protein
MLVTCVRARDKKLCLMTNAVYNDVQGKGRILNFRKMTTPWHLYLIKLCVTIILRSRKPKLTTGGFFYCGKKIL